MSLTGALARDLQQAILDAFPRLADLRRLVRFHLDANLDEVVKSSDNQEVVFELIVWVEGRGRVEDLIDGALVERPQDRSLREALQRVRTELRPQDSNLVQKGAPAPKSAQSPVAFGLPDDSNFDLNRLVDDCMDHLEKMPPDRALVGFGIPCVEGRLLENFCLRLKNEIGRGQAQVRDALPLYPLVNSVESAVDTAAMYRYSLGIGDVICPVVIPSIDDESHERGARFWEAVRGKYHGQFKYRPIVIMGTAGRRFPPEIVELPSPEFTDEHVSYFIRDVVKAMNWPPACIVKWKQRWLAECRRGECLRIVLVYNHIVDVLKIIKGEPGVDLFLAELEKRAINLKGEPSPGVDLFLAELEKRAINHV